LRIVAEVGIERRRQRIGAEMAGQDGVSVRRRASGAYRSGCAAGPSDILHHEFLPEVTGEDISDDAPRDVGWPAGRDRTDTGDSSGRISFRLAATRRGYRKKCSRHDKIFCHFRLPSVFSATICWFRRQTRATLPFELLSCLLLFPFQSSATKQGRD